MKPWEGGVTFGVLTKPNPDPMNINHYQSPEGTHLWALRSCAEAAIRRFRAMGYFHSGPFRLLISLEGSGAWIGEVTSLRPLSDLSG